jgi:hypothetical protein
MKTMNRQKNIVKSRFVACVKPARLLQILERAVVRPAAGGAGLQFDFSTGCQVHHKSMSRPHNRINLTRCEAFRGKVSRRQNQKTKQHLEERTHPRQTHE